MDQKRGGNGEKKMALYISIFPPAGGRDERNERSEVRGEVKVRQREGKR